MLGNRKSAHIPRTDKHSLAGPSWLRAKMNQQLWQLVFTVECIFTSSQCLLQKRKCMFHATKNNNNNSATYTAAGNVNGSVQTCENTQCCVGYLLVTSGKTEVNVLACDIAEETCPDATCKPQTRFNGRVVKCVCNTDFCNSNITWIPEQKSLQLTYSYSSDAITKATGIIVIGSLLILCVMVAKSRTLFTKQKENLQTCHIDDCAPALCSCQTTKASEIDIADIELQQVLCHGHFTTVWQGKYQGSTVAVKVFPADRKYRFSAEKEVYELPLMKHAGIVYFLGTGRKPDSSWLIVLQFVEYGSLHSYLCKHTINWMLSLKLCQSLSEGLSYLHCDLHRDDVHKPPVAHRDLSSSNVLVRADGTCVLCDFGCATILRSCLGQTTTMEGTAQMGTLCYMAPEFLEGSVNVTSSLFFLQGDIYSLGLLLWEIWMRCSDLFEDGIPPHLLPYESELGASVTLEDLIEFVFNMQKRPTIPNHWKWLPQGSALQELLTDCWDCDPDARLTVQCVLDRLATLQSCCSP